MHPPYKRETPVAAHKQRPGFVSSNLTLSVLPF